MKSAVYFTKSFKPNSVEEAEIEKLRSEYRIVAIRNSKFYKEGSGIETQYDGVYGAIVKPVVTNASQKTESSAKPFVAKQSSKPWENNK